MKAFINEGEARLSSVFGAATISLARVEKFGKEPHATTRHARQFRTHILHEKGKGREEGANHDIDYAAPHCCPLLLTSLKYAAS